MILYLTGVFDWGIWLGIYMTVVFDWGIWLGYLTGVWQLWLLYLTGVFDWGIWLGNTTEEFDWGIWQFHMTVYVEWRHFWLADKSHVYEQTVFLTNFDLPIATNNPHMYRRGKGYCQAPWRHQMPTVRQWRRRWQDSGTRSQTVRVSDETWRSQWRSESDRGRRHPTPSEANTKRTHQLSVSPIYFEIYF